MTGWKENKVVGIVAGVTLIIVLIIMSIQISQNIQQKRKRMEELKKWENISQLGKVSH